MLANVVSALTSVISMIGAVFNAIFSESGNLAVVAPIFLLFIAYTFFGKGWGLVLRLFNKTGGRRRRG